MSTRRECACRWSSPPGEGVAVLNSRIPISVIFGHCVAVLAIGLTSGCKHFEQDQLSELPQQKHYQAVASQIEYPIPAPCVNTVVDTSAPWTVEDVELANYRDVSLEETIRTALSNSRVLRDLGARTLEAPELIPTTYDPAIRETDPIFGIDGALSAYDAIFSIEGYHQKNDRAINNAFFGGGTRLLQQDRAVLESELSKRAMTGTEYQLRHITDFDSNNAPGNLFASAWNTNIELGVRQPLLLGAGVGFNRIAGPDATPGQLNGVLLARVDTDISLADFELGVNKFISNVENAYWDLYFAYRDLDAKIRARDAALDTWRRVKALNLAGRIGGEEENEAQALEQYYRFQQDVQTALSGRLVEGTRDNNGSRAGTFRGLEGVQVAERRLRLLMGLPITDAEILRPADEPTLAEVIYDWHMIAPESLERRVELRKQRWLVKRQELELRANKRFLLPTLDAVGLYRYRGFGKDLFQQHSGVNGRFNNAWDNLTDGDFQEWQLGLNMSLPVGYRQAHAAVRNSELQLARARAILYEQEREVMLDLSDSIGEAKRAYAVTKTAFNRLQAARRQFEVLQDKFENQIVTDLDLVLEAQRRYAAAEIAYFRTRVEYVLALKNIDFAKGSLLEKNQVHLAEGPWSIAAHHDAAQRTPWHSRTLERLHRRHADSPVVSVGEYGQLRQVADGYVEHTDEYEGPVYEAPIIPTPIGELDVPPSPDESESTGAPPVPTLD
jgi:hypothetical protein